MKNIFLKLILILSLLIVYSCETFDLDQTVSPSQVKSELLDPIYAFTYVQLQLPDFVSSSNDFTQEVTRQMAMTGGNTYNNAYRDVSFDRNWSLGYNILNAVKIMEPKSIEKKEYWALGASKVIRVYVLMSMVDMYGDIPYSEALQGNANLKPKFDKSADIYKQLLIELDEAIATLNLTNSSESEIEELKLDLYYTSQSNWITLANTLKLKIYSNARLAGPEIGVSDIDTAILNILNANDYIDTTSEDFAFKYGNSRFSPNTRHPLYNDQYELGGGAYIANYMMWAMTTEKGWSSNPQASSLTNIDPRTLFYFYKQDSNPAQASSFVLPKRTRPDHFNDVKYRSFYTGFVTPYLISNWTGQQALPSSGYWGRDHGDNSGIPADAENRTVCGIYPIGGKYGTTYSSVQNGGIDGGQGAGIMPMILSSYVHFTISECSLIYPGTIGASYDAWSELKLGIEQSIDKATNLIPDYPYLVGTKPLESTLMLQKNNYVDFIKDKFDLAATNKLELVIKEYFIASWGNGNETYNSYRRTGYPSNFQPTLEENSGAFFSTALYPGSAANNNPNTPANVRTKKVFWDKAAVVLH